MEEWQVLMNVILVGLATLTMKWGGFMGSVIGVVLYMLFSA